MDTSTLITVLTFLGVLGGIIFLPWLIYCERKKLSMKHQRIGCVVSAVLLLGAMYLVFDEQSSKMGGTKESEELEEDSHHENTNKIELTREELIPYIVSALEKNFGEENVTVELNADTATVTLWNSDLSAIFDNLVAGISDETYVQLETQVDDVQQLAIVGKELFEEYCIDGLPVKSPPDHNML